MKIARVLTLVAVASLGVTFTGPMAMAAGTTAAAAKSGAAGGAHAEVGEKLRAIVKELDLSADQKKQIHTILEDFKTKMEVWRDAHKDELKGVREKIQAARQAKDKQGMKAALEELKTLMETAPKPKTLIDDIAAVLTPEQKAKFEKAVKELRETMRDRIKEKRGGTA